MLSGAVAGILRVGAVVLTGGALGGGVYFLVQVGEEEDASRLQAEATATLSAPAPLSPPAGLSPPADVTASPPTPTFPPAPITPPAVDTSDWKTYTSPLGFTIKYPPGWEVQEREVTVDPPLKFAKIIKQHPEGTGEIVVEGGTVKLPPGVSHAWIEIYSGSVSPAYPLEEHLRGCVTETPQADRPDRVREGSTTTLAGRQAGRCFTQELDRTGKHTVTVEAFELAHTPGRVLSIAAYVFDGDAATFALVQGMLSTVSFEDGE